MNEQTNDSLEELRGQITAIIVALQVVVGRDGQASMLPATIHDELSRLLPHLAPAQAAAAQAIITKYLPVPPPMTMGDLPLSGRGWRNTTPLSGQRV